MCVILVQHVGKGRMKKLKICNITILHNHNLVMVWYKLTNMYRGSVFMACPFINSVSQIRLLCVTHLSRTNKQVVRRGTHGSCRRIRMITIESSLLNYAMLTLIYFEPKPQRSTCLNNSLWCFHVWWMIYGVDIYPKFTCKNIATSV